MTTNFTVEKKIENFSKTKNNKESLVLMIFSEIKQKYKILYFVKGIMGLNVTIESRFSQFFLT